MSDANVSESGYVDVEGGRLRWEASGSGRPLVLLHGFSFDRRMWDPQIRALAADYRVVSYDLRGFGLSTSPVGPYRHMDDLRLLLAALKIERPILVGLSLGANVALAYTIEHGVGSAGVGGVAGLILTSPGLVGHHWKTQRPPEAVAAYAAANGVAAGKQFWLAHPLFASLAAHSGARAAVTNMVTDYSGWHWQNTDLQQPGPDIRAGLETLSVPTLVVSGDQDVDGYREIAAEIAATVPGSRFVRIPTGGHVTNMECQDEFTRLVREFVRTVN